MRLYNVLVALTALASASWAWDLRLYSGSGPTDPTKAFSSTAVQRCYSLSNCWDGKIRAADWSGLPSGARIVFYTGSKKCQGKYASGALNESGVIDFATSNMAEKVSSFMIWQSDIYASSTLADAC